MRQAASLAAVLSCAALLGACAAPDPLVEVRATQGAGRWRIETATDRITNAPAASAYVTTRQVAHAALAFPKPAMMQLRCFKDAPIVRFAFGFKIGSTRNAQFGYAFDKAAGHQPPARFIEGYTTVIIEDQDEVARFVSQLGASKSLYVRIIALNAGRTSAEFETEGAAEAIAAAYALCPAGRPQPGQKTAAQRAPAAIEPDEDDAPAPAFQTEEEQAARQVMGWFNR